MKGAMLIFAVLKIPLKLKWKPENNTLSRQKNNKGVLTKQKGIKKVKIGKDLGGLN